MTFDLGLFTSEESSNQAHKVTHSLYPQGRVETLILVTIVEPFWSSALCNQYFLRCTGICCFCGYECRRQLQISWQNVSHVLYYLHPEQKRKYQNHCKIMALIFHLWFALNLLVLFRQSISPKSYFFRESSLWTPPVSYVSKQAESKPCFYVKTVKNMKTSNKNYPYHFYNPSNQLWTAKCVMS